MFVYLSPVPSTKSIERSSSYAGLSLLNVGRRYSVSAA